MRRIRPQDLGIDRLFERVRDAVIVAEASTGRIVLWNPAATNIFGYSPSEALGLHVETLVPERLKAQHRTGISRYHETGHGYYVDSDKPLDLPALSKMGEEVRIEMTLSPISLVHDDSEDGSFVLAIIRDVTERKRAQEEVRRLNEDLENRIAEPTKRFEDILAERNQSEEKLRHSEERFRSLVQNASDIITILEADGTIRYVSPALERVMGYHPEERVGAGMFSVVHPDDLEWASSKFTEILKTPGVHLPVEFRVPHKDGSWRHLEHVVNNLLHEPAVKGIVVNSRDITERRQTEEALRQSEARYRAVIEQTIEGIYLGAADTKRVLESNAAFQRMLGYTAEELRGMHIYDFVAHDRETIDSVFQIVLDKGHRFIGERRYRRKDGSEVEVESSATVISYGDKEVLCTVVRDVTKRREAEEVLKQSEERFRALTQNSSDFITLLRANGSVRYQGPSVERILGYRPEEMVGDNVFHYVHPEDLRRVEMAFAEGLKDPRRRPSAEYRFRHKDGWWVWLESVGTNLLDDPRVGEYVVNSRDITERKHAEEALRESEAKYRLLVEQTPAITYVEAIDEEEPEHNILYVSPQIEELLGYSPEEWMANPALWAGLLHPDDRERVLSEDARTEETGEPFSVEYRGFTKDGSLVWLYDEAVLVRDDSGRTLYWQGVKYDITERKKAEEELREANRRLKELAVLKADFTAMVAHELDTPLAVIRGYAEMLATGELEPAEQSRALAKIDAETEVLNTLVADVRAAASLEQEDFSIEAQRVPVRALLDAAARFGATLPGNHLLVTENAADERVWADPHRVGQVLRNLLSNAANYSSDGTPIELRAKPSETPGHVRIEVADCGPGIHPDDVSCVFEKFGRGRDQYGRKVQGTGLGLYLSRRIMQAHGSDLTLDQAPESGAVFAFELETAR